MKSPFARQLRLAAIFSASLLGSIRSFAQSTSYSSVEAIGDTPLQLGYYASANKNCTPAALPTLRVTQAPKHGTLTAKRGVLATSKIAGCPDLKIPAQAIFYQSRREYVGPDHLGYEITSANGEVKSFDISIEVKPGRKSDVPAPGQKL